jgi:hypothetical protein
MLSPAEVPLPKVTVTSCRQADKSTKFEGTSTGVDMNALLLLRLLLLLLLPAAFALQTAGLLVCTACPCPAGYPGVYTHRCLRCSTVGCHRHWCSYITPAPL